MYFTAVKMIWTVFEPMFAFGNVELFIQTESGVGFLTGVIEQLDHNEHSIIVANTKYLKKCVHLRWGMRSS